MTIQDKIGAVFIYSMILGILFLMMRGCNVQNELEAKGKPGIGWYYSKKSHRKGESNFFCFYVDGTQYNESTGSDPKAFKENRGRFYRIRYSEENKGIFKAYFDQEVTDTAEILEAGFSRQDLRNALTQQRRNRQ
ncbi:hypothetical protein [Flavobacterium sp.]